MKLVDFIAELETQTTSKDKVFMLTPAELKKMEKSLFECDEFKNVARINFLETPSYLVDEETGEPISTNREFLGGKTQSKNVSAFNICPSQDLKFNKIVDLYTITLNKRYSLKEDIKKPGIWVYPTFYDEKTFVPTNQIRIIWDPIQLDEALKMVGKIETSKQRLLRMFEKALDSMEPNIPCEYVLSIRCSTRSIENSDEIKVEEIEPELGTNILQPKIIDANIPSIDVQSTYIPLHTSLEKMFPQKSTILYCGPTTGGGGSHSSFKV